MSMKQREINLSMEVARLSLKIARRCMSDYAHPKSPKLFTQPQLMACLMLKTYHRATYRMICEMLGNSPPLCEALGLRQVPHYTTLQKFAARPEVPAICDVMLREVTRRYGEGKVPQVGEVAIDATGMESTAASAHFVSRTKRERNGWVRVSLAAICAAVAPCAMVIDWGPGNDMTPAMELVTKTQAAVQPTHLLADAAYDSEELHRHCREEWGVKTHIPLNGRRNADVVNGRYRKQMRTLPKRYNRRALAESLMSAIKRTTGAALTARTERTLFNEAALRVLGYAFRRA